MSTLKTTNLQNPDSAIPNIVLNSDGSVDIASGDLGFSPFLLMGA
jgi:hypothetical protein